MVLAPSLTSTTRSLRVNGQRCASGLCICGLWSSLIRSISSLGGIDGWSSGYPARDRRHAAVGVPRAARGIRGAGVGGYSMADPQAHLRSCPHGRLRVAPAYASASGSNGPICVKTFQSPLAEIHAPSFAFHRFFRPGWWPNIVASRTFAKLRPLRSLSIRSMARNYSTTASHGLFRPARSAVPRR